MLSWLCQRCGIRVGVGYAPIDHPCVPVSWSAPVAGLRLPAPEPAAVIERPAEVSVLTPAGKALRRLVRTFDYEQERYKRRQRGLNAALGYAVFVAPALTLLILATLFLEHEPFTWVKTIRAFATVLACAWTVVAGFWWNVRASRREMDRAKAELDAVDY